MRKWYSAGVTNYLNIESLKKICDIENIPLKVTPSINCEQTMQYMQNANAEVGISLGNGYISSKVFNIPKMGMINIHDEQLPAYQNAQSIIWQIYNGSNITGYTIHKIDNRIDTGDIIHQENINIDFRNSIADTVAYNYSKLWQKSASGLLKVLENFDHYFKNAKPQQHIKSYTTPNLWQYFKIVKQYHKLKSNQTTS